MKKYFATLIVATIISGFSVQSLCDDKTHVPGSAADEQNSLIVDDHNHLVQQTSGINSIQDPRIVKNALENTETQLAEKLYAQALASNRAGNSINAIEKLQLAIETDGGHEKSVTLIVAMLLEQNKLQDALDYLNAAVSYSGRSLDIIKLKAHILTLQGNYHDALNLLEPFIRQASSDLNYLALLAAVYQRAEKFDQSVSIYKQLVNVQPNAARWWMALGISSEAINQYQQAAQAYQKAINLAQFSEFEKNFTQHRLNKITPLLDAP